MSNLRFLDLLQEYPFHLFDASGFQGNAAGSVFDPVLGFSGCTTPEWTVTVKSVKAGNFAYPRPVVQGVSVGPITLSRGVRWYDSDFWNWLNNAVHGTQPVRRDIFLVHFLTYRMTKKREQQYSIPLPVARPAKTRAGSGGGVLGGLAGRAGGGFGIAPLSVTGTAGGLVSLPPETGMTALASRIPARCFYMRKCIPTGYKAGGDFDANSANVSVATLTLQPYTVDEVTVATLGGRGGGQAGARAFSMSVGIANMVGEGG